jgi:hypothetical protein
MVQLGMIWWMCLITEKNWNFENIRSVDEGRAVWLESAGGPDELAGALAKALEEAIKSDNYRIAVDSKDNGFIERRAIVQFQVAPELYDWFFNARTGYRAQFWIDPTAGLAFNEKIIGSLSKTLSRRFPQITTARRIEDDGFHDQKDTGATEISRAEIVRSLSPRASKIWIAERLYSPDGTINRCSSNQIKSREERAEQIHKLGWT